MSATGAPASAHLRGAFGSNAAVLQVAEHNGASWQPRGGVLDSTPGFGLGRPTIKHAADGSQWVAWGHGNEVRVSHFNGTAFVDQTIDPVLKTFNGQSSLTLLDDEPVVAGADVFLSGKIDVRRLHQGVWEPPAIVATIGITRSFWLAPSGDSVLVAQSVNTNLARVTRLLFP